MGAAGIILECNPFHRGHRYIIEQARQISDGPVIAVMSGSFMQRGIPAVSDWRERAGAVLEAGADVVLELPAVSSCAGAAQFASGAVTLLLRTGMVTDLVFGSESGDVQYLTRNADFLLREPEDFRALLLTKTAAGRSYPAARSAAAAECSEHILLPDTPNDLLGEEYIRVLLEKGSGVRAHAIPRIPAPSASSLRENMRRSGEGLFADDFSGLLLEKLLMIDQGICRLAFTDYAGVESELSNRIRRLLPRFRSWSSFCEQLKTRDITYTAVSRALTRILLDITKEDLCSDEPPCARVLGCRRNSLSLLGPMQEKGLILITGHGDAVRRIPGGPQARHLSIDLRADELWQYVRRMKYGPAENASEAEGGSGLKTSESGMSGPKKSGQERPGQENSEEAGHQKEEGDFPSSVSAFSRPFLILP